MRVRAVIEAETIWGVLPANPALTIVKYSSKFAVTAGASSGIWETLLFSIIAPEAETIFSPMRMSRSNAAVRALSLTSLQDITTSERIAGIKCRELFGRKGIRVD